MPLFPILLLALAAAPDPRPLEADVKQAAITCTYATVIVSSVNGRIDARGMNDATWFGYAAAIEKSDGRPYSKQAADLAERNPPDMAAVKANAPAIVAACHRRWPNSRRGAKKIVLPVEPFERAFLCYSVVVGLQHLAKAEIQLYGASAIEPVLARWRERMRPNFDDATLAKHGIVGGEAFYEAASRAEARALRLGNFNDVVDACLAS